MPMTSPEIGTLRPAVTPASVSQTTAARDGVAPAAGPGFSRPEIGKYCVEAKELHVWTVQESTGPSLRL